MKLEEILYIREQLNELIERGYSPYFPIVKFDDNLNVVNITW